MSFLTPPSVNPDPPILQSGSASVPPGGLYRGTQEWAGASERILGRTIYGLGSSQETRRPRQGRVVERLEKE